MPLDLDMDKAEKIGLGLSLDAFDLPEDPAPRPHPAKFPDYLLKELRHCVPKGRVLDPFGGVGGLGRIGPEWDVTALELEHEWAIQGLDNLCANVVIGDAQALPFPDRSWPTICTSPAYGNRFADSYVPKNDKPSDGTRRSYKMKLGRPLTKGNGGSLHFGRGYEDLHCAVIQELWRVLEPGGTLVLNVKDFIRRGTVVGVVSWWTSMVDLMGFRTVGGSSAVPTAGDRNSARHRKQGRPTVDHEIIMTQRKPRLDEIKAVGKCWWDLEKNRFIPMAP